MKKVMILFLALICSLPISAMDNRIYYTNIDSVEIDDVEIVEEEEETLGKKEVEEIIKNIETQTKRKRESIAARHFKKICGRVFAVPAYPFKKSWSSLKNFGNSFVELKSCHFINACKHFGLSVFEALEAIIFCVSVAYGTDAVLGIASLFGPYESVSFLNYEYQFGSLSDKSIEFVKEYAPLLWEAALEKSGEIWELTLEKLKDLKEIELLRKEEL